MAEIKDKVVSIGVLKSVYNAIRNLISGHTTNTVNPHKVTAEQAGAVPVTRKVNGKSLSEDITVEIEIDSELSDTSENPVQNKVISAAIGSLKLIPDFDDADNGKILCIMDGKASWEEIVSAENEYF